jgi:hypothetical protein
VGTGGEGREAAVGITDAVSEKKQWEQMVEHWERLGIDYDATCDEILRRLRVVGAQVSIYTSHSLVDTRVHVRMEPLMDGAVKWAAPQFFQSETLDDALRDALSWLNDYREKKG